MRNILSILLISVVLFSCSDKKIITSELTNANGLVYNEDGLYTGKVWDIYNHKIWEKIDPWSGIGGWDITKEMNGTVTIGYTGYYKGGKKSGNWKFYYPDYTNIRKAFGEFEEIDKSIAAPISKSGGFVRYQETYKEGIIIEVLVFNHLGEKVRKEKYENGKRHGIWEYYISGSEIFQINYKNGEVVVWEGLVGLDGYPDKNGIFTRIPEIKLFINGKETSTSDILIGGESVRSYDFDQNIKVLEGKSIL